MKVIVGAVIGAIVAFAWSFVSWMVLNLHDPTHKKLAEPQEQAVLGALSANLTEDGVYFLPSMVGGSMEGPEFDAWAAKHRKGPVGMLIYHKAGSEPMPPTQHAIGFGIDLVAALLVCVMLAMSGMHSFFTRFAFVGLLAVFASLVSYAMEVNYIALPVNYAAIMVADLFIGWTLAGFFMAMIVKPREA